jgi:hypothetical protein
MSALLPDDLDEGPLPASAIEFAIEEGVITSRKKRS